MELKQMKIVTFAMIKYPRSQDFIRPVSKKDLNIHHQQSSRLNMSGSLLAVP